jgi:uncharacterized protein (TIGR02466 family)
MRRVNPLDYSPVSRQQCWRGKDSIMQSEMMNLFAVPVVRSAINRSFTSDEMRFFQEELRDPINAISNFSSRNKSVLNAPAMTSLRAFIQSCLDNYLATVFSPANNVKLKVTQSWLTLSRKGESHHSHVHPNSVVSGVLYINLAKDDGINFYRNQDSIWYELLRGQETYHNAYRYFIGAKVGDVLLFPSNQSHGVREVVEDVERVSLSFNTFFDGELGREEFANSLKISVG